MSLCCKRLTKICQPLATPLCYDLSLLIEITIINNRAPRKDFVKQKICGKRKSRLQSLYSFAKQKSKTNRSDGICKEQT